MKISRDFWKDRIPSRIVMQAAGMLTGAERKLIHWISESSYREDGYYVDAGAFLGASACALADGAPEFAKSGLIHSFDLFKAEAVGANFIKQNLGVTVRPGESFRHIYEQQTHPFQHLITVHEGNFLNAKWSSNDPIDVLFIDLCKTEKLTKHMLRYYFPALRLGSKIIHQDYYYWLEPSIHLSMWSLSERTKEFAPENPSQAYLVESEISDSDIADAIYAIDDFETGERAFYDILASCETRSSRLLLEVARCIFYARHGKTDIVSQAIEDIRNNYSDLTWVSSLISQSAARTRYVG